MVRLAGGRIDFTNRVFSCNDSTSFCCSGVSCRVSAIPCITRRTQRPVRGPHCRHTRAAVLRAPFGGRQGTVLVALGPLMGNQQ